MRFRRQCRYNFIEDLISDDFPLEFLEKMYSPPEGKLPLEVGAEYDILAARVSEGSQFLYVADEDFDVLGYPVVYPERIFGSVIESWPHDWRKKSISKDTFLISPIFWNSDQFYENLIEGKEREVRLLGAYSRHFKD